MAIVLIVEDESMILVLAESVIQHAGNTTLSASSLSEARCIIESDAAIDIVFTDLNLGADHDGGIEIGNLVASARPGTPVLYTSGRELTDGLKLLFVERSGFQPKPYTDHEIISALAKLLHA